MGNSQFGEDDWIIQNLKPEPGIFCEVGAYDGVASSNTVAFERLGWRGLCIEPDPKLAAACSENRNAVTWCCAAGNFAYAPFFLNYSDRGTSTLDRSAANGKAIPVIVVPLQTLIKKAGFDRCDLLSIDTEGSELEVWATRGPFDPGIVIVEHLTMPSPSRADVITEQFKKDGYRVAHVTTANLIFVKA